jgi:hypothetical protein
MKVAGVSTANFITLSTFPPTSPTLNNTSFASDNISIRVSDNEPFLSPFSEPFNLRTRNSQARCRDDGMRASHIDMIAILGQQEADLRALGSCEPVDGPLS